MLQYRFDDDQGGPQPPKPWGPGDKKPDPHKPPDDDDDKNKEQHPS